METIYTTATTESGTMLTLALKNKKFSKKETLKQLYAENTRLEAENSQKDFIIEELREKLEQAETKAREQEKYFLQELSNKFKVGNAFYNIKGQIEELQKIGAIEF